MGTGYFASLPLIQGYLQSSSRTYLLLDLTVMVCIAASIAIIFTSSKYFSFSLHPCFFNPLCFNHISSYSLQDLLAVFASHHPSSFRILENKLTSPNKLSAFSSRFCLLLWLLASLFLLSIVPSPIL